MSGQENGSIKTFLISAGTTAGLLIAFTTYLNGSIKEAREKGESAYELGRDAQKDISYIQTDISQIKASINRVEAFLMGRKKETDR